MAENKVFDNASLMIVLILSLSSPGYGSEHGERPPPEPGPDIITQAFTQQEKQGDEIRERTQKRSEARSVQKKGEGLEKKFKGAASPLKNLGTMASIVATVSGDPHAKIATAAFELAMYAVEGLGKGIAKIVIGIGRYRERSQEILSAIEVLVEGAQQSLEKIKDLQKKQQELLDADQDADKKAPESSPDSSSLKQFGQKLYNAQANLQNKIRQATDYVTNEKAKKGEKLKAIQADLKKENENYAEIIKLIQIKLLQDAVKEIDRKINIGNTIQKLQEDKKFYENARKNISTSKSTAKKERADIEEKNNRTLEDLVYYMNFQHSPTETLEVLTDSRVELIEKINELSRLTNMEDIRYLEEKGIEASNPQMDRSTIVILYREIDDIKKKLDELTKVVTEIDDIKGQLNDLRGKTSNSMPSPPVSSRLAGSRIEKWKVYSGPDKDGSGK